MVNLLNELDSIRVTKKFKRYGFALGAKDSRFTTHIIRGLLGINKWKNPHYNGWIKKVEELSKSKDKKISAPAALLTSIGYSYAISKGVDNDYIIELRKLFNEKVL